MKQVYEENAFGKFQHLSCFHTKMILFWLTKLGISEPCTNIQSCRRFYLDIWKTSKHSIADSNLRRTFVQSFKTCLVLPGKWFCICRPILVFLRLCQDSITQKMLFRLLPGFKISVQVTKR